MRSPNKALIKAVKGNNLAGVEQALEQGADIETLSSGGYTPLMLAAMRGYDDIVRFLVDNGANIRAEKSGDATDMGITAEHLAKEKNMKGSAYILESARTGTRIQEP